MARAYPTPDESFRRLHRAGWPIGETGTASGWLVTGTNGENVLEARGSTQAEAWWRAVEQAEALGMLGRSERSEGRVTFARAFRFLLLALLAAGCSKGPAEERIALLRRQVERQRQASAAAVAAYAPKVSGRLDDLRAPAAAILRQLPGIARVEVLIAAPKPTHRIIHLRDWHHVPRDQFALDVRQAAAERLSEEEVDELYREHLLQVELVQVEQVALLRCLVKRHGLRRVLAEGFPISRCRVYSRPGIFRP